LSSIKHAAVQTGGSAAAENQDAGPPRGITCTSEKPGAFAQFLKEQAQPAQQPPAQSEPAQKPDQPTPQQPAATQLVCSALMPDMQANAVMRHGPTPAPAPVPMQTQAPSSVTGPAAQAAGLLGTMAMGSFARFCFCALTSPETSKPRSASPPTLAGGPLMLGGSGICLSTPPGGVGRPRGTATRRRPCGARRSVSSARSRKTGGEIPRGPSAIRQRSRGQRRTRPAQWLT
jgi:hypothetical protein